MLAEEGEAQSGGGEGEGSSARAAAANTGRCVVCLEEPLGAVFIKWPPVRVPALRGDSSAGSARYADAPGLCSMSTSRETAARARTVRRVLYIHSCA